MNCYILYVNKQAFSWTNGPGKASMANSCFSHIERERETHLKILNTGSFWGTESLQKRRWESVALPPRRKCSTNADGCWENVHAFTFHWPICSSREANRPIQQPLGILLLSPALHSLHCNFSQTRKKKSSSLIILVVFDWIDVVNRCPHMVKGHYIFGRC